MASEIPIEPWRNHESSTDDAVLLSAGSAYAADPATADRDFYAKAAAGGMAEVQTGALAQIKGNSGAVREFGEMMVRDHTKANDKLKQIAGRKNIELPTEPDAKHKAKKQELEAASGAAFDSAYMQAQVADHEATESLLKQQSSPARTPRRRRGLVRPCLL
jgi:putative membrane protein